MHTEKKVLRLSKILKNQELQPKTGFFPHENRVFGQYLDNNKGKKELLHRILDVVNRKDEKKYKNVELMDVLEIYTVF